MRFYVETFGCQMNVADSQEMSRRLVARGLTATADPLEADVFLLNTCTVREHAEHRALSLLGRLKEWKTANRYLIFAGCAAERIGEDVRRRFPQVTVVAGAKSLDRFEEILDRALPEIGFDDAQERADAWGWLDTAAQVLPAEGVTGHVTIMRGCNFSCSYCIVPAVRGREVYRPALSILAEVAAKAARGQSEIMLLGQTVNSYRPAQPNPGPDGAPIVDFADLLRAVDRVPGVRRIRFMSPHPFYATDRFVQALADCRNIAPHLHLPSQSGSDAVLSRMKRNYTRAGYLALLGKLRRAMPDLSITTDIIVGFPGETEADFDATLSFVEEAAFDGAYSFKYSPRPGTASAALPDDVSTETKEERLARLLALTESLSLKKVRSLEQEILVEACAEGDNGPRLEGRTADARKIFVDGAAATPAGRYIRARVDSADGRTLYGTPLEAAALP